jgi:hypothetical protein
MATNPVLSTNPTGVMGGFQNGIFPGSSVGTGGPGNFGYGSGNMPAQQPSSPGSIVQPQQTGTTMNPYAVQASGPNPNAGTPSQPVGSTGGNTVTDPNNQTTQTNNLYGQTQQQQNRTVGELENYYGEGVGSLLDQYLQSGAGYNSALTQQSVDAETNAMQQQAALGSSTLNSQLGAQGISGNSSVSALANSQYQQGVTAQENNIAAQQYYQMWNQSQEREYGMLGQVANVNATGTANQGNWMSDLGSIIGLGSAGSSLWGDLTDLF